MIGTYMSDNAILVRPAYGRKYSTKEQVLADWDANKDFVMMNHTSKYISKRDFAKYGNPLDRIIYFDGELALTLA